MFRVQVYDREGRLGRHTAVGAIHHDRGSAAAAGAQALIADAGVTLGGFAVHEVPARPTPQREFGTPDRLSPADSSPYVLWHRRNGSSPWHPIIGLACEADADLFVNGSASLKLFGGQFRVLPVGQRPSGADPG
jgi:hypothetical protein